MQHFGFCITAHGYGHAARISAVIQALLERSQIEITIVSQVPKWFFQQSFTTPFVYHPLANDVGMVQKSSLSEDPAATLLALKDFYPYSSQLIDTAADCFSSCDIVVCDIAPLGIVAAQKLGIPSVLIENFTWDWIYSCYIDQYSEFSFFIDYLFFLYTQADYHIQTTPVCSPTRCDLHVFPVSRKSKGTAAAIRQQLATEDKKLILLTMGGGKEPIPLDALDNFPQYTFIIPGVKSGGKPKKNLVCLQEKSSLYHPDLVTASDAVIGKAGYSTVAEVFHGQAAFGYVARKTFPESPVLEHFIEKNIPSFRIPQDTFYDARWVHSLIPLLKDRKQKYATMKENGCDQIADLLLLL